MRLKIINTDGIGHHTQIVDAETGQRLEGVLRADISITPEGRIVATLQVRVTLDVVVEDPMLESVR